MDVELCFIAYISTYVLMHILLQEVVTSPRTTLEVSSLHLKATTPIIIPDAGC